MAFEKKDTVSDQRVIPKTIFKLKDFQCKRFKSRARDSISRFVGPSVRLSVRPSVRPSLFARRTRLMAIGLVLFFSQSDDLLKQKWQESLGNLPISSKDVKNR